MKIETLDQWKAFAKKFKNEGIRGQIDLAVEYADSVVVMLDNDQSGIRPKTLTDKDGYPPFEYFCEYFGWQYAVVELLDKLGLETDEF